MSTSGMSTSGMSTSGMSSISVSSNSFSNSLSNSVGNSASNSASRSGSRSRSRSSATRSSSSRALPPPLNDMVSIIDQAKDNNGKVRYFAYGSNLCSDVFSGLRSINFSTCKRGFVPGYVLHFPSPAAASIRRSCENRHTEEEHEEHKAEKKGSRNPSAQQAQVNGGDGIDGYVDDGVHGVVYDGLGLDAFLRLWLSEGANAFYDLDVVHVKTYGNGEALSTLTFVSKQNPFKLPVLKDLPNPFCASEKQDLPPTASYINCIRRGAREQNLDKAWCKKLDSIATWEENIFRPFATNDVDQSRET
mmetsp:Transcript_29513/g.51839  ORF Transcript_29513/g.51839 Transcript_29513/m.51839 type:complete len:304 (-) Transcript_29513:766-1677(-)